MPALAPECCECGPCGCSSHSDTGLRPAGPLTGSTCQPSWRVAPGSRPDGQRFQSDDRWADALNIWLLTRGPANLVRRCTDYRTGRGWCFNVAVTFCTGFFTCNVRLTFSALVNGSSCSAHFSQEVQLTVTLRAKGFSRLQSVYFRGEDAQEEGYDDGTAVTGVEPVDH